MNSQPAIERFISEPIKPVKGSFDSSGMSRGEPGLPASFIWRDELYEVDRIIETWKESSDCRNGSDERYLRKHWYRIESSGGQIMTIYFDRQARSKPQAKLRWWLYSVIDS